MATPRCDPGGAASSTASSASSAAITSTGIGSGLNITAIVASLTSAFGAGQQNQITNQQTALDAQVSAFGTFTSSLDSLQASLSALENPTQLAGFDASVADPTIASATAASGAVAGTYTLSVQNLATSATLTSQPPVGALLISPFVAAGASSSVAFDATAPAQSLEKLLRR